MPLLTTDLAMDIDEAFANVPCEGMFDQPCRVPASWYRIDTDCGCVSPHCTLHKTLICDHHAAHAGDVGECTDCGTIGEFGHHRWEPIP